MTQDKSSTSSGNCKVIGAGKVLAYLRGDLQQAKKSVFIIGPWLDGFFTRELITYIKKTVNVRCLVRIESEEAIGNVTYQALQELSESFPELEARSLPALHAKVIIIDDSVVYLGSTNWYKYSLEQAKEVTVRAGISELKDLAKIIDGYWETAEAVDLMNTEYAYDKTHDGKKSQKESDNVNKTSFASKQKGAPEINYEVLDPIALKVLQNNPKAFIKRKR